MSNPWHMYRINETDKKVAELEKQLAELKQRLAKLEGQKTDP